MKTHNFSVWHRLLAAVCALALVLSMTPASAFMAFAETVKEPTTAAGDPVKPKPTATPTAKPTATPTAKPTATPTAKPTATPTAKPAATPTATPTEKPAATPTAKPAAIPTATPTAKPTATPTAKPTATPVPEYTVELTGISFKLMTYSGTKEIPAGNVKYSFTVKDEKNKAITENLPVFGLSGITFERNEKDAGEGIGVTVKNRDKAELLVNNEKAPNNYTLVIEDTVFDGLTIEVSKAPLKVKKTSKLTYNGESKMEANLTLSGFAGEKDSKEYQVTLTSASVIQASKTAQTLNIEYQDERDTKKNYIWPKTVTATVAPKTVNFKVSFNTKYFDNTKAVPAIESITTKDAPVGNDKGTLTISEENRKGIRGSLELNQAEVGEQTVSVKKGKVLPTEVLVGKAANNNYSADFTFDPVTVKNTPADETPVWEYSIADYCPDPNKTDVWFKDGNFTLKVKDGIQDRTISSKVDGTYAATASFTLKEGKNTLTLYVKKKDGSIYAQDIENIYLDTTAPKVEAKQKCSITFGQDAIDYTLTITDTNGSGVDSDTIRYYISSDPKKLADSIKDEEWKSQKILARRKTNEGTEYTVKVTAPAYGYLYIKVADNVGNVKTQAINQALVLENNAPTVSLTKTSVSTFPLPEHTFTVSASDTTNPDAKDYSGIQKITVKIQSKNFWDKEKKIAEFDMAIAESPEDLSQIENYATREFEMAIGVYWESGKLKQKCILKDATTKKGEEKIFTKADLDINGTIEVSVTATDFCGNVSGQSEGSKEEVEFDNGAPTVDLKVGDGTVKSDGGEYYYRSDNWKLEATFTDAYNKLSSASKIVITGPGNATAEFAIPTPTPAPTAAPTAAPANAPAPAAAETALPDVKPADEKTITITSDQLPKNKDGKIADGEYTITVQSKDEQGNETNVFASVAGAKENNEKNSVTFQLDNTAPVLDGVNVYSVGNYYDDDYDAEKFPGGTAYVKKGGVQISFNITEENYRVGKVDLKVRKYDASVAEYTEIVPPFNGNLEIDNKFTLTAESNVKHDGLVDLNFTVWPKENAKVESQAFNYTLSMTDAAGNELVLGDKLKPDPNEPDKQQLNNNVKLTTTTDGKNEVSSNVLFVLDNVAPEVTIDYTDRAEEFYYDEGTYYNEQFTADYTFTDANLDVSKLHAKHTFQKTGEQALTDEDFQPNVDGKYTFTVAPEANGEHKFYARGVDKAGNPLTVRENDRIANAQAKDAVKMTEGCETEENTKNDPQAKIMDSVAPKATLSYQYAENEKPANDKVQNNRIYLNKHFIAQWDIEEEHFDANRVFAMAGTNLKADEYHTDTVKSNNMTRIQCEKNAQQYTFDANTEGLYRFSLKGTDKAGNEIVLAQAGLVETSAPDAKHELLHTSYITAVDTVAPALDVTMRQNDSEENFYAAKLKEDRYAVSVNDPYQKKSDVTLTLKGDDKSLVKVEGSYLTTKGAANGEKLSVDLKISDEYNPKDDWKINGQQILNVETLKITDRAGNFSEMQAPATNIYLDTQAPSKKDLDAPVVNVAAQTTTNFHGDKGTPLYKDQVVITANIADPSYNISSSGLYQTCYRVMVRVGGKMEDWTSKVRLSTTAALAQIGKDEDGNPNGVISYQTRQQNAEAEKGKEEDNEIKPNNETLTKEDEITFTFDTTTFNYNDVELTVWAEDNAGNKIEEHNAMQYVFGIDVTAPAISVSYDNNQARNDKYFKAPRLATVTVIERNFDPANTKISTESGAINGWSRVAGASPNGDDDKWMCTVQYGSDGDYTMAVETKDLVGHYTNAVDYSGSTAPTSFTIDLTAPIIEVNFDNNDVRNGKYFNKGRVANINIAEHNFGAVDAQVAIGASIAEGSVAQPGITGWNRAGDANITSVNFANDGDYTMNVHFVDLAGNEAQPVTVDPFTVDTTAPTLEITGVEDRSANKGDVAPKITYHDVNYAPKATKVSIVGVKNKTGKNLNGSAKDGTFGGSFVCENIEVLPENDDIYRCTGHVEDLAGNQTEAEIRFSVNRFGSNYVLDANTAGVVEKYYISERPVLKITEINVDSLEFQEITATVNGEILTLSEGKDYTVEVDDKEGSWKKYIYTILADVFQKDGTYNVTVRSTDTAGNENSNRTAQPAEYAQPIDFALDMTAPTFVVTGVENDGQYIEDARTLTVYVEDNMSLSKVLFLLDGEEVASFEGDALKTADGVLRYDASTRNDWQNFTVKVIDNSGNESEDTTVRFLLTNNLLVQYVNNTPILVGSLVGLGLLILLILLLVKRKKDKQEQAANAN